MRRRIPLARASTRRVRQERARLFDAPRFDELRFAVLRLAVLRLAPARLAPARLEAVFEPPLARRLRVAAAFLPAALRLAVLWLLPLLRPPFFDAERFSVLPRPEPDFLPPPDSLFTVAQARRSASPFEVPRFS